MHWPLIISLIGLALAIGSILLKKAEIYLFRRRCERRLSPPGTGG